MAINVSGSRAPAQVLQISSTTVIEELKKQRLLEQVNTQLQQQLRPTAVNVVQYVEEAELEEMWSFVGCNKQQRWL